MKHLVAGYLFLFIFRPFEYWEFLADYRIERIYAVILIITLLLSPNARIKLNSITIAFTGFLLLILASSFWAINPDLAIEAGEEYAKLFLLFFGITMTVKTRDDLIYFVKAFLVIFFIYESKSLWEFLLHDRHVYRMGIRRLTGIDKTYSDPNTFAASALYAMPFAVALYEGLGRKKDRYYFHAFFIVTIICIMLTGSRSGALTLLLLAILLFPVMQKKTKYVFLCVVLVFAARLLLPGQYIERWETIYNEKMNPQATESAEGRLIGLKQGLELFSQKPITGFGAGNFVVAKRLLGDHSDLKSHSMIADLLSELGLFGLVSFGFVLGTMVRSYYKCKKACHLNSMQNESVRMISYACMTTIALLLFNGLFGHNLYRYTWLIVGSFLVVSVEVTKILQPEVLHISENSNRGSGKRINVPRIYEKDLSRPERTKSC